MTFDNTNAAEGGNPLASAIAGTLPRYDSHDAKTPHGNLYHVERALMGTRVPVEHVNAVTGARERLAERGARGYCLSDEAAPDACQGYERLSYEGQPTALYVKLDGDIARFAVHDAQLEGWLRTPSMRRGANAARANDAYAIA